MIWCTSKFSQVDRFEQNYCVPDHPDHDIFIVIKVSPIKSGLCVIAKVHGMPTVILICKECHARNLEL